MGFFMESLNQHKRIKKRRKVAEVIYSIDKPIS